MLTGGAHANIQAKAGGEQEQGEMVDPLRGGRLWDPLSKFYMCPAVHQHGYSSVPVFLI